MRMIEPVQIKLIHVAVAKLGLSDDDYRTILQGQFKKESCKALTYVQADKLIDYFKKLGFKIPPRRRHSGGSRNPGSSAPGNVVRLPSRDQRDMINALAGKIVWRVEGGFKLWMKKYLKTERVKSVEQAQACIEGLKGMLAHQGGDKWGAG